MGVNMDMPINTASLAITPQMLSLIAEIDEFKGACRALGTLAPDRLLALRRVATIESIGSSTRIEGSKLSDSDVERLLSNIEIRQFDTRDEQEVAGYADMMETIFASFDAIAPTEKHIKQLHRDLLAHSGKDARHRGACKTNTNHVSAFDVDGKEIGVVFETATPFDTPRLMAELVEWVNETLESVIEASKEGYYLGLRRTQGTIRSEAPAWESWIGYFLQSLRQQKARLEAKTARERLMIERLPALSVEILELAKAHGRITNGQVTEVTGANRNTVKKHLQALVSARHLVQHGSGKATWYSRA
jgi:Fic family protein